ncbi:MAG: glycine zipper 2TM domain-containing protein [Stenotrophobium sp.]
MNKLTFTTLLAGLVAVSAAVPAFAGERDWDDGDSYDSYQDGGYSNTVYAQVVSSTPIYRQVQVSQPQQECRNERVAYREPPHPNVAATILGGIIGGVAGHQIGGGRGRDVATALGAVIGANIGAQQGGYYGGGEQVSYQTRCDTVYNTYYDQRLDGYNVTYRYNGRLYNTRMPYDPGRRVQVQVNVQPVSY